MKSQDSKAAAGLSSLETDQSDQVIVCLLRMGDG